MIIDWTYTAYQQLRTQLHGPVWNFSGQVAAPSGPVIVPDLPGIEHTVPLNRLHHVLPNNRCHHTMPLNRFHFEIPRQD